MFAPIFTGALSDIVPLYLNTKVKIFTELMVGDKKGRRSLLASCRLCFVSCFVVVTNLELIWKQPLIKEYINIVFLSDIG